MQASEPHLTASSATAAELWRLDGRVALVAGASSGLGARFARVLQQAGAQVLANRHGINRFCQVCPTDRAFRRRDGSCCRSEREWSRIADLHPRRSGVHSRSRSRENFTQADRCAP
jgi:hypothetical protein